MAVRALIPFGDVPVPEGVRVDVYDGVADPPADLSDVAFYALPYDRGRAPAELLARMPSLRVVQALTAGVEKLLPLIPEGVTLCNGQGLHDASTAEHALALILAAQRELPRWVRRQATGEWDHDHTRSLAGSHVTILGYGAIGTALEQRLLACEATVTRVASRARPDTQVHGVADLPELLPGTDILVMVLPENPGTIGLVGSKELAGLPDDALVVNVGRGRTLDAEALRQETATRRLRAALDVTDPEPLPADDPLWSEPGVIITPHVAGGSTIFHPKARDLVSTQLHRFAAGEPLLNVVERVPAERSTTVQDRPHPSR